MELPLIPKAMARRIVSAQTKVTRARDSIINYDERIQSSSAELAEFEANPKGYASTRYGQNPVDSYPVQTRISRVREDLDYRTRNLPRKHDELAAADLELEDVQLQVARELAELRPNSPGRVPWPAPLPEFSVHRLASADEKAGREKEWAAQRGIEAAEDRERRRIKDERLDTESEAEWAALRSSMTPEERDEFVAWGRDLEARLKAREFTFSEFLARLRAG